MIVTININYVGSTVGDYFDIYSDLDGFATPIYTNIPRTTLEAGYLVEVDNSTTQLKLVSSGCGAECIQTIGLLPVLTRTPTHTPTQSITPTQTPIVSYLYRIVSDANSSSTAACSSPNLYDISIYALSDNPSAVSYFYTNPACTIPYLGDDLWWKILHNGTYYAFRISNIGSIYEYSPCS